MISAGEHIGWISSQLGHGNIGVTIRVYAKWLEEADPLAGSKAHELYVSKGGSEQLWISDQISDQPDGNGGQ
jgi:hypothetical protein